MTFEEVLVKLKAEVGSMASREGWNGKGMWISIQHPDECSKMGRSYIYMSTVNGELVPWVASQTDMLADDWDMVYYFSESVVKS